MSVALLLPFCAYLMNFPSCASNVPLHPFAIPPHLHPASRLYCCCRRVVPPPASICIPLAAQPFLSLASVLPAPAAPPQNDVHWSASISRDLLLVLVAKSCIAAATSTWWTRLSSGFCLKNCRAHFSLLALSSSSPPPPAA